MVEPVATRSPIQKRSEPFRWDGVELLPYKADGNLFRDVTRQVLFEGRHDLPVELRYFEVGVGGHSTLERHEHAHFVVVVRGSGKVFVGEQIYEASNFDTVEIPPMTWHQFKPNPGEVLGFLCVVSKERDRPQRPTDDEYETLARFPGAREFLVR